MRLSLGERDHLHQLRVALGALVIRQDLLLGLTVDAIDLGDLEMHEAPIVGVELEVDGDRLARLDGLGGSAARQCPELLFWIPTLVFAAAPVATATTTTTTTATTIVSVIRAALATILTIVGNVDVDRQRAKALLERQPEKVSH